MRKVINNKLYDTDTARECGSYSNSCDYGDWHRYCETLYVKRTGEFFLHGEGGPMSRYAKSCGGNSWSSGETIIPLTYDNAREWAEKNLDADEYEEIFGLPSEDDGDRDTLIVQLPAALMARIRQGAAENGETLTAHVEKLLRAALP